MKLYNSLIMYYLLSFGLLPAAHELLPRAGRVGVDNVGVGNREREENGIIMEDGDDKQHAELSCFYHELEELAAVEKLEASDLMRQALDKVILKRGKAGMSSAVALEKMSVEEKQYALLMREWAQSVLKSKKEQSGDGEYLKYLYDTKIFDPVSEFLRPKMRSKSVPLVARPKSVVWCGDRVLITFNDDNRLGIYDTWLEKIDYSPYFASNIQAIAKVVNTENEEEQHIPYVVLLCMDSSVLVYDVEKNEVVLSLVIDEKDKKEGIAECYLSNNASYVICSFQDKKVVVYERETGKEKYRLADKEPDKIIISLDGRLGAVFSYFVPDWSFWDIDTGEKIIFDENKIKNVFGDKFEGWVSVLKYGDSKQYDSCADYSTLVACKQNDNRAFILGKDINVVEIDGPKNMDVAYKYKGEVSNEKFNYLYLVQNYQEHCTVIQKLLES